MELNYNYKLWHSLQYRPYKNTCSYLLAWHQPWRYRWWLDTMGIHLDQPCASWANLSKHFWMCFDRHLFYPINLNTKIHYIYQTKIKKNHKQFSIAILRYSGFNSVLIKLVNIELKTFIHKGEICIHFIICNLFIFNEILSKVWQI